MKALFMIAIVLGFSNHAIAQLTDLEQIAMVEKIAKDDRREMWIGGYEEVSSQVEKPTKTKVDEFIAGNKDLANPLAADEITSIYRCFDTPNECQVFTIDLYSEMYGGYGTSRRWVLLNPVSGRYETILHSVYEE